MTSLHAASDSLVCCNSIYRTSKLLSPPAGGGPGNSWLETRSGGWTNSSLGGKWLKSNVSVPIYCCTVRFQGPMSEEEGRCITARSQLKRSNSRVILWGSMRVSKRASHELIGVLSDRVLASLNLFQPYRFWTEQIFCLVICALANSKI